MKKNIFILALLMGVAHSVPPVDPTSTTKKVNLDSKCCPAYLQYPTDKIEVLRSKQKYCQYILDMIESKIYKETGILDNLVNLLDTDYLIIQGVSFEQILSEIIRDTMNTRDCLVKGGFYYEEGDKPNNIIRRLKHHIQNDIPDRILSRQIEIQSEFNALRERFDCLKKIFNEYLEVPIIRFHSDLERELMQSDYTLERFLHKTFLYKMKNLLKVSQHMVNLAEKYSSKYEYFYPITNTIDHNYNLITDKMKESRLHEDNPEQFEYYYLMSILEDKKNTGNINHYLENSKIQSKMKEIMEKLKLAKEQKRAKEQQKSAKEQKVERIKKIMKKLKLAKEQKRANEQMEEQMHN